MAWHGMAEWGGGHVIGRSPTPEGDVSLWGREFQERGQRKRYAVTLETLRCETNFLPRPTLPEASPNFEGRVCVVREGRRACPARTQKSNTEWQKSEV